MNALQRKVELLERAAAAVEADRANAEAEREARKTPAEREAESWDALYELQRLRGELTGRGPWPLRDLILLEVATIPWADSRINPPWVRDAAHRADLAARAPILREYLEAHAGPEPIPVLWDPAAKAPGDNVRQAAWLIAVWPALRRLMAEGCEGHEFEMDSRRAWDEREDVRHALARLATFTDDPELRTFPASVAAYLADLRTRLEAREKDLRILLWDVDLALEDLDYRLFLAREGKTPAAELPAKVGA